MSRQAGVRKRHAKTCPARNGSANHCRCTPSWVARVWDGSGKETSRSFPTEAAAKAWRADTQVGLRAGAVTLESPPLRDALTDTIEGMTTGRVRTRSGDQFKPAVCGDYRRAAAVLTKRWGARRLSDLRRRDVQRFADEMHAAGRAPTSIRNALLPLRLVYRLALQDDVVTVNPLAGGLRLPAVRGRRDRIVPPDQAAALLAALLPGQRAAYALAFYAGLRRGELLGLRWQDVDLDGRELHVVRAWCSHSRRMTQPKSAAGLRTVPMAEGLRGMLLEHRLASGRTDGLVVSPGRGTPLDAQKLTDPIRKAWLAAELEAVTLHEARHTYAALMIAAGVGFKSLQTYMGHSSITVTLDRYGHLLPGTGARDAALLDQLLGTAAAPGVALTLRNR